MQLYVIEGRSWEDREIRIFLSEENRDNAFNELIKNMVSEDGIFFHKKGLSEIWHKTVFTPEDDDQDVY